jgi:hypothetical protein
MEQEEDLARNDDYAAKLFNEKKN